MKKTILTILMAFVMAFSMQAKDKVIDRPAFRSKSADSLYPVKVELTKTATIVHFHMNCAHGRSWSMTGAKLECDGKTYACQRGRILTRCWQTTSLNWERNMRRTPRWTLLFSTSTLCPKTPRRSTIWKATVLHPGKSSASVSTISFIPTAFLPTRSRRTMVNP